MAQNLCRSLRRRFRRQAQESVVSETRWNRGPSKWIAYFYYSSRALELNEFARREGPDSCGESGDPPKHAPFTFEQFTTELDDNDPFVLGLIGILVKVCVVKAFDPGFRSSGSLKQEVAVRRDRKAAGMPSLEPSAIRISEPSEAALRRFLQLSNTDASPPSGWVSRVLNHTDPLHAEGNWLQRLEDLQGQGFPRYNDSMVSEPYVPPTNASSTTDFWAGYLQDSVPGVVPRSPDPTTGSSVLVGRRRTVQRARTAEFASHTSRRRYSQRIGLFDDHDRDEEMMDDDFVTDIPTPTSIVPVRVSRQRERRGYDAVRDAAMRESTSELSARSGGGQTQQWIPPRIPTPNEYDSALTSRALLLRSRSPLAPGPQGGTTRTLRRGGLRAPELEFVSRLHSPPPRPTALHRSPSPMYYPLASGERPADASAIPNHSTGDAPSVFIRLGTPRSLSPGEN